MFPARYTRLEAARQRFGSRVDRLGHFYLRGDPDADAVVDALSPYGRARAEELIERGLRDPEDAQVPDPLRHLISKAERLPSWWDPDWATQGGQLLLRSGVAGGLVLGFKCLVGSYFSPAGNKPLMFTKRLEEDVSRRLAETGRFVRAMAEPEGLARGTKAFRAAIRVRLVHAHVRHYLSKSPRWDAAAWGTPINQADMAGTNLLFSHSFADGLEQLGVSVSRDQREALLHLWRGIGHVLGLEPELVPGTVRDAQSLNELLWTTQAPPDEDSRKLALAFLEEPIRTATNERERRAAQFSMPLRMALAREFVGADLFDRLGFPKTSIQLGLPLVRQVVRWVGAGMRLSPFSEVLTTRLGNAYWEAVIEQILRHDPNVFEMPGQPRGLH